MSKRKSVFRLFVDIIVCPLLLLFFLLTAGIVILAQPVIFKPIYEYSMKDRPMLVEDGLKIAEGLTEEKAFTKINKTLTRGKIGKREIYHFEDIRNKIATARGLAIVSSIIMVLLGVACSAQWRFVIKMTLIWFATVAVLATIWAILDFRHFFRSLHWWVFQDDSWILPDNCYSLVLYPYPVWQALGATLVTGLLMLLLLSIAVRVPHKK